MEVEVGQPIPTPENIPFGFKFESWTNGEGVVVETVPEGGVQLSPSIVDINLAKDSDGNYEIADVDGLEKLQAFVNAGFDCAGMSFKQTADIDFKNGEWAGISTASSTCEAPANAFQGVYDGGNYAIKNITYTNGDYGGFFNWLYNATVRNLTIVAAGRSNNQGGSGILAGMMRNCTIENVTTDGELIGTHHCCGFAVKAWGVNFENCVNKANLSVDKTTGKVAGFVGFQSSAPKTGNVSLTFKNCENSGTMSFTNTNPQDQGGAAGFIGWLDGESATTFENCTNNAEIATTTGGYAASFIAWLDNYGTQPVTATGCVSKQVNLPAIGINTDKGKVGGALVSVSGLNFATVENNVATFVADDALADKGEYKVMVDGAAPAFTFTAIDQTITFKTNLCDDVDFAGITLDESLTDSAKIEPTADANGVTFTCVATQTDPIPPVTPKDPDEVKDLLDKLADATALKAIITTPEQYTAFQTWAHSISGKTSEDVAASTLAAKSFEMSSVAEAHLFTNDPKIEITETTVGDSWTATVKVLDGEQLVAAIKAIEDQVQVTTTIETASSWTKATATAEINDGIATITITKPGDAKGFMRVNAKK